MNKQFQEQVDRVIAMIKDKGKDNILLSVHPETEIPDYMGKLIDGMEVKRTQYAPKGQLYFVYKKPYSFTMPDEFDEAEKFLETPRGVTAFNWFTRGLKKPMT